MCGIFGYVTNREEALGPILIEAAQRLTYRGYDSVGAATLNNGSIDLRKDVGKVDTVAAKYNIAAMRGQRGIAQLRWATFGEPSAIGLSKSVRPLNTGHRLRRMFLHWKSDWVPISSKPILIVLMGRKHRYRNDWTNITASMLGLS